MLFFSLIHFSNIALISLASRDFRRDSGDVSEFSVLLFMAVCISRVCFLMYTHVSCIRYTVVYSYTLFVSHALCWFERRLTRG